MALNTTYIFTVQKQHSIGNHDGPVVKIILNIFCHFTNALQPLSHCPFVTELKQKHMIWKAEVIKRKSQIQTSLISYTYYVYPIRRH